MDIGDIISSALSLLAIALTIIVYFKHDKKLKKQEEKLYAYQLKKIDDEESESKKAQIRGNIIKEQKEGRTLRIFNSGKTIARNIRIDYLSNMNGIIVRDNHFPFEMLNPQYKTEIYLLLCEGAYNLKIKFLWDDEFQKNNEFVQVLTF